MIFSRAWRALMRRNLIYRKRRLIGSFFELILPIFFVYCLVWIKKQAEKYGVLMPKIVKPYFSKTKDTYNILSFTDYVTALQAQRVCIPKYPPGEGNSSISADEIKGWAAQEIAKPYDRASDKNFLHQFTMNDLEIDIWRRKLKEPEFDSFPDFPDFDDGKFSITGMPFFGFNWQVPFVKCDAQACQEIFEDAQKYCEYSILAISPSKVDDTAGQEHAKNLKNYLRKRYPQLLNENKELPFNHELVQIFESGAAIDDYVKDIEYGSSDKPKIALAVVFSGTKNSSEYDYTIRVNSTNYNVPGSEGKPGVSTTPDTKKLFSSFRHRDNACSDLAGPIQGPLDESCTGQYIYNGALTIQRLINDWIMEDSGAKDLGYYVAEHGVQYVPFPRPEYRTSGVIGKMANYAPLFLILGFLYPIAMIIGSIASEKELRQKELMKMMSVAESDIEWAWFCSYFIFHLLTSTLAALVATELFSKSDLSFLWLFWVFAFTAMIIFSQALSALSSKSTRGVLIGILVFFIGFLLTKSVKYDTGSPLSLHLISLHPAAAVTYLIKEMCRLEDAGAGVTIYTIFTTDNPSGFTFFRGIYFLFIDCLFWSIMAWYLNRAIAPEYGQALPFYFPFTKSYWFPGRVIAGSESTTESAEHDANIPVEQVSDVLRNQATEGKSIEIHNLEKIFKDKTAVDGLNLSMYSGQITALLGHNGAGKTTTINLLTGALAPTGGCAVVMGKDVRTQLDQIREDIGICLQHDCLFPQLTVREHVQLFCRLKGVYSKVSFKEAEARVDAAILDVGLSEKSSTLSSNLSGGMKRKLSVAMAFCGDSKVVVLDEPTSGMDPFSRRFTWNIIRQYRQNRCIILTTHFMDEADVLGDRIAIMAEGQLRCVGSSMFLKKTFGVGYQLTIAKNCEFESLDVNTSEKKVTDIVTSAVSEAKLLNSVGTEMSFQLPMGASSGFVPMLEELDREIDEGRINSYGVSITTLDEVFQIIARNEHQNSMCYIASSNETEDTTAEGDDRSDRSQNYDAPNMTEDDADRSVRSRMDLQKDALFTRHMGALLNKRRSYFFRDKKAWCCTAILPSLFVLFGFLLITYTAPKRDLVEMSLDLKDYNVGVRADPQNPIPFNQPMSEFSCQPGVCSYEFFLTKIHNPLPNVPILDEKYYLCGSQSRFVDFDEKGGPLCSIDDSDLVMSRIRTGEGYPEGYNVSNISESSHQLLNTSSLFAATQYGAIYFTHEPNSIMSKGGMSGLSYGETVYERCLSNQGDYVQVEEECKKYKGIGYVISYNFTALHAAPLYQGLADEAIIREALDDEDFKISASLHPLPITRKEAEKSSAEDAFVVWFLIVLSFPFIAGAYATFIVRERESKAKHLQTVAGVQPVAYWLSTILWDVLNYQFPLWISVILMYAFNADVLTTTKRHVLSGVLTILILYGPAVASFTYVLTFRFSSPSLCNVVVIVSGFLVGFGGPLGTFLLRIIGEFPDPKRDDLILASKIIEWILRCTPSFCLGNGIFKVINIELFDYWNGGGVSAWDKDMLLIEVIFLVLQILVYFPLAIYIDILSSQPWAVSIWQKLLCRCSRSSMSSASAVGADDDDDVLGEEERIASGRANGDLIVLSEITKVYDNGKVAVDKLSLGIPPGQCFGLLGVNGAGKTTTMGILTAEFPPSSGDATLAGYSVCNEPEKTRRRIGYCPQFDAHFDNLTGREHVELYASIKGIPQEFVKEAAATKLAEVGLSEYDADRVSSEYSGGMKRRLSLACAMIGQPQIIFLDECSTGVDPVARREIWHLVSGMITRDNVPADERTSVILTTHSMEECEALCPRIGIMANGRLRCIGSAQHLKTKFGRGYQLEMKVKVVNVEDTDYSETLTFLASQKRLIDGDEETAEMNPENIYLNLQEAEDSLNALTGDDFLSSKLNPDNESGYFIYKDATSAVGVAMDELASYVTLELRMRKLHDYINQTFPNSTLRERQDLKVRYEISSEGLQITQIFSSVETMKDNLKLADYCVSQTSLEQVFNLHAAEAERLNDEIEN